MRKFKVGDKVRCRIINAKANKDLVVLGYCNTSGTEYVLLGNVYAGHMAASTSKYYDDQGNDIGDVRDKSGHYYAREEELSPLNYERPLEPKDCFVKDTSEIKLLTNKNNIIRVNQNF